MIYARFRYRSELYISSIQLQLANKVATKSRMIYDIYITTKISFLCKRCYISFPLFLRTVFTLTFLDQATTVFNFQIYIKEGKLVCNRSYLKNYLTKRDLLNSVHFPILSFENQTLNPSRHCDNEWTIRNILAYVEIPLQTDTMIMAIILGSWPLPVGVQRSWAITRPTKIYTADRTRGSAKGERRRTNTHPSSSDIAYI